MIVEDKSEMTQDSRVGIRGLWPADDTGDTEAYQRWTPRTYVLNTERERERERDLFLSSLMLCCVSTEKNLLKPS